MKHVEKALDTVSALALITLGVFSACALLLCIQSFIAAAMVQ
jgi:hypothetical protein